MTPSHAFVVPAFGDSPYLDECLASLRGQSSRGSEILVATSTPSPHIDAIAARHGVRIAVNPQGGGIASDWNFALVASTADLVTLAHQDDVYAPEYSAAMLDAFARHPAAVMAFCAAAEHTATGPRPANLNVRVKDRLCARAFRGRECIDSPRDKLRLLAWGNPVNCPSVVLDRRKLPDFRFDASFASNLDWDAWTRLARGPGGMVWLRQRLVSHRVHAQSETTALIAGERRLQEDRLMFRRFWPRPVAATLGWVYRLGYRSNRV